MGGSSCTGPQLGYKLEEHLQLPRLGGSERKETPDFMLEHFIILYCDVTAGTPHRWGVTLMARTIKHSWLKQN